MPRMLNSRLRVSVATAARVDAEEAAAAATAARVDAEAAAAAAASVDAAEKAAAAADREGAEAYARAARRVNPIETATAKLAACQPLKMGAKVRLRKKLEAVNEALQLLGLRCDMPQSCNVTSFARLFMFSLDDALGFLTESILRKLTQSTL